MIALFAMTVGCLCAGSTNPPSVTAPATVAVSHGNEEIVMIEDKALIARLVEQVKYKNEFAYLYEARARYFANKYLPGAENWFNKQAAKERMYAEKIQNHLRDAGVTNFSFPALKSISVKLSLIIEVFKSSLETEKELFRITEATANLADANKEHYT